jgi:hypothetical protein
MMVYHIRATLMVGEARRLSGSALATIPLSILAVLSVLLLILISTRHWLMME